MRRQLGQTPTMPELSPRVGTRRGLLLFWLNERRVNSRYRSTQVRRLGRDWKGACVDSRLARFVVGVVLPPDWRCRWRSGESCSFSHACSADFERSGAHPVGLLIPTRAALMLVCAATLVAVAAVAPARALAAFHGRVRRRSAANETYSLRVFRVRRGRSASHSTSLGTCSLRRTQLTPLLGP